MSLRRTAVVAVAAALGTALIVASSVAADQGHGATQEAMDSEVGRGAAPGVLAQAADEDGVWHGSAGIADRGTQRPPRAGDRFRIGSLTKPFIAVVVLQLDAEGTVDLDDTVERWLPGVVRGHGHDGRRITVRQLLRHTSGVRDFIGGFDRRGSRDGGDGPEFLRNRFGSHQPADQVRAAMRYPPAFAPGTGWGYSNTNYVLLGMVVEEATGNAYAQEVRRRITGPLGLNGTYSPGSSRGIRGPHGRAYSTLSADSRGPLHDVTRLDPSFAGASGEMISTTGDLIRFLRALLSGDLLPQRQLREMKTTVHAEEGSRYGLGLTERRLSCGTRVWGHEGMIHGSHSTAAATADGSHSAAFNLNSDRSGSTEALLEAEFCG